MSDSTLLQGTLELLVLKTLSLEPMHGWGIAQRLQQMSSDVFQVNQGSLYPALQRMKRKGWIRSEWRVTASGRRFIRRGGRDRRAGGPTVARSRLGGA